MWKIIIFFVVGAVVLGVVFMKTIAKNAEAREILPGESSHNDGQEGFPALVGDYMGLKKPGLIPEVFAPGVVSTDNQYEFSCTFSPDGKEFYFTRRENRQGTANRIMYMMMGESGWTEPVQAPFSSGYMEHEPFMTLDGKKLFFQSRKPGVHMGLVFVERSGSGWTEPKPVPLQSEKGYAMYASVTRDGTLYFTGIGAIFKSRFVNGSFQKPEKLPKEINFSMGVAHPYISPDERYIIYDCQDLIQVGSKNQSLKIQLYINFRNKDGSWTNAKKMGNEINQSGSENCPYVSPDGKYLFFGRSGDIYWVDSKVIENLR